MAVSSLRARALLVLAFAFLVMLGVIVYHENAQRQARLEDVKNSVRYAAESIVAEQRRIIDYTDQVLLNLRPAMQQFRASQNCSGQLGKKLKEYPEFRNIGIVALNGDIVCTAMPLPRRINIADRDYFQQALKTPDMVVSGALVSRSTGLPTFTFTRSLRDEAGHVQAFYYVALDISWLQRAIAKAKPPEGSRVGLVDNTGLVLARYPDPERAVGKSIAGSSAFRAMLSAAGSGVAEETTPFDGVRRIFAVSTFVNTAAGPVFFYVGVPEGSVTANIERDFIRDLGVLLVLLAVTFGVIWFGSERWLLRPIAALAEAARRLGAGDLTARAGIKPADDELGRLARSFDQMAEQRKRVEETLRQARTSAESAKAEAERANQAKDHFLAVLSHELRTPLTPVLAAVELLQRQPSLDPNTSEPLEIIRRNVQLQARLIDDLLDLTRIAQGKLELKRKRIDMATVIERAVEIVKPDIEARRLHFGVDVKDAPFWVDGDASRLQQVVWNLLTNAVKFTPEGGCVGLRCECRDDRAVIEVSDSGIGIEPEATARIFDAFEQGGRVITRQFGGLGLGLAIARQLIELHGGEISVASEGREKGATFRVALPLSSVAVAPQERKRPLDVNGMSRRILLVEDNGDTLAMMKLLLESFDFEVGTAGDVAQALKAVESERFDLLISDLGLPDRTGIELMRELRRRGSTLKGIALSGYGHEQDVRRSKEAGFSAHLTKPADADVLLEAVARLL
jgi:signal transduction histidine kinase